MNHERRKELVADYMQAMRPAGVYAIRNTLNGKVWVDSTFHLEGARDKHWFVLKLGSHHIKQLQKDWKELGEQAFDFELLEELPVEKDEPLRGTEFQKKYKKDLETLEELWLEKLQPYDDQGYNSRKRR